MNKRLLLAVFLVAGCDTAPRPIDPVDLPAELAPEVEPELDAPEPELEAEASDMPEVPPPRCGDGRLDPGEACDGAVAHGTCSVECVLACDPGFGDCNGDGADGCEADFASDRAHCGGCRRWCTWPTCIGGECEVDQCVDNGGEWDPGLCEHTHCGVSEPCEQPSGACRCDPLQVFEQGVGCRCEPECLDVQYGNGAYPYGPNAESEFGRFCVSELDCPKSGLCNLFLPISQTLSSPRCRMGVCAPDCNSYTDCNFASQCRTLYGNRATCLPFGGCWTNEQCTQEGTICGQELNMCLPACIEGTCADPSFECALLEYVGDDWWEHVWVCVPPEFAAVFALDDSW